MVGRWFFFAIVGLALLVYVKAPESDAASGNVTQTCSASAPGTVLATVSWPQPGAGAQQTWFDISVTPGFIWGWFQGFGPLSTTQTAYAFDRVPPGVAFYYRANTLYSDGIWRETASGAFVSSCTGGGGAAPATGAVTQTCDGAGNVTVTFNWTPGPAGTQYLDLSTMNNGFVPGTFVGAGPVASGGRSFTWYGIARGVTHYWRVNVLTAQGWVSSNTGSFGSSTCLPPLKACIGYLSGITASGRAECEQLLSGSNAALADCIGYIMGVDPTGRGGCGALIGVDTLAVDCLLALSGGSHFGRTSCRIYVSG